MGPEPADLLLRNVDYHQTVEFAQRDQYIAFKTEPGNVGVEHVDRVCVIDVRALLVEPRKAEMAAQSRCQRVLLFDGRIQDRRIDVFAKQAIEPDGSFEFAAGCQDRDAFVDDSKRLASPHHLVDEPSQCENPSERIDVHVVMGP